MIQPYAAPRIGMELDSYTMTARFGPATVVLLPVVVVLALLLPENLSSVDTIAGGVTISGLGALLTGWVRDRGSRTEKALLEVWGRFPTISLLVGDTVEDTDERRRAGPKLNKLFPKLVNEKSPGEFEITQDAAETITRILLEKTRDSGKFPLVAAENASYGFRRNLYALKPLLWGTYGVGGLACVGYAAYVILAGPSFDANMGIRLGALSSFLVLAIGLLRTIDQAWVGTAAKRFARALLRASLALDDPPLPTRTPRTKT